MGEVSARQFVGWAQKAIAFATQHGMVLEKIVLPKATEDLLFQCSVHEQLDGDEYGIVGDHYELCGVEVAYRNLPYGRALFMYDTRHGDKEASNG